MKLDVKEFEGRMKKSVDSYVKELSYIRAGRANPDILNRITADYYGTPTPIPQMAQVSMPDARTLAIQPWDASTVKLIEKAILASDIGITPISDGKVIRLTFQPPTEEKRRELSKQISKMGEEAKVAIRNIRRDANDKAKDMKKNGEMTEERRKELSKQISKMGEDAKVAIRNIRRDANDKVKAQKKDSLMTEDEAKASDKSIQDLTDKYIKEIDNVTASKTKEIMEI